MKVRLWIAVWLAATMMACAGKAQEGSDANGSGASGAEASTSAAEVSGAFEGAPVADADTLYAKVKTQVDFGPRTPGSKGHAACAAWIAEQLRSHGIDSISIGNQKVTTAAGLIIPARNIFASIRPEAPERIILLAHYDTRPMADQEPDKALRTKPIDGANDGASGVAVLLECARLLAAEGALPDDRGIDLLFTDVEDSGDSEAAGEESWCLGSRQWAENMPYKAGKRPVYGILLDMVGGRGARFHREYFSNRYAPTVVNRVWAVARQSGFEDRFPNEPGGAIVDDHVPLNEAGIPTVDIIESVNSETGSFNPTWHTLSDNLEAIDAETLRIVTQTVLNTITQ